MQHVLQRAIHLDIHCHLFRARARRSRLEYPAEPAARAVQSDTSSSDRRTQGSQRTQALLKLHLSRSQRCAQPNNANLDLVTDKFLVPLNNAMLALQTLDSDGVFKKTANTDHEIEYTALNGSLVMMSKVLNDV